MPKKQEKAGGAGHLASLITVTLPWTSEEQYLAYLLVLRYLSSFGKDSTIANFLSVMARMLV